MVSTSSLAFRLVVAAVLWITAALAVGGFLISTLFRDSVERNFDARLTVHLDSLIGAAELDASGAPELSRTPSDPRFDLPYSGWYWQVWDHRGTVLLRSRSLWDQAMENPAAARQGIAQTGVVPGPSGVALRARFIDITLPDQPAPASPLRFAVAANISELETELRPFNLALLWSLAALGIGLGLAVAVQVRIGLRPLRGIRIALKDIRAGRSQRMAGNWPDELRPLVRELDALLEHNAVVLERARTHVGNLAHALKTPLAVLGNEATRKGPPDVAAIERQVSTMRRWVDHYLARARAAATGAVLGSRTPVAPVIDDLRRTLERIHVDRNLTIKAKADANIVFRGERQDLEEMMGNLMDNACKWAKGQVMVAALAGGDQAVTVAGGDMVTLMIDDDGPGLPEHQRMDAVGRGRRLDESAPGSGLGLAIVSDIAGLYGGALQLEESPLGGLRATLTLPMVEP